MFHMYVYEDPGEPALRENLLRRSVCLYVRDSEQNIQDRGLSFHTAPDDQDGLIRDCFDRFRLERTEKGKPYLADPAAGQPAENLHFSISHSGGIWAVVIGPKPCGLDIQENRPVPYEKLAARYFPGNAVNSAEDFYRLWCRREALAKYMGQGFFGVSRTESEAPVYFRELEFREGFTAVWCSGGKDDQIEWIR